MRNISAGNLKDLMLLLNFGIYCTKPNLLIFKTKDGREGGTQTKKEHPELQ